MPAPSYHFGHRLGGEETLALYKNNMAKMQKLPSFGFEENFLRLVFKKKAKRFQETSSTQALIRIVRYLRVRLIDHILSSFVKNHIVTI